MDNDNSVLVVCGAGGHGRVVASVAAASGWRNVVFLDPRWPALTLSGRWSVEGSGIALGRDVAARPVVIGIGDNTRRMALFEQARAAGLTIETLVHPTAWVCPGVPLGSGTVVMPRVVVNYGASIAESVILNTAAIIEHDCTIGEGAHISPGAILSGRVSVGARAWVGAGVSVRQGIFIGAGATIGVGSAVVKDIPDGEIWAGVPARRLEETPVRL